MATQLWLRNPYLYIREAVEVGYYWFAWDQTYMNRYHIKMDAWALKSIPAGIDYRILMVNSQGAAELQSGDTVGSPSAVYPVWEYGQDWEFLEELTEYPIGEDEDACLRANAIGLPALQVPVFGQEHRIVLTRLPAMSTARGQEFLNEVRKLRARYPKTIFHVHGPVMYSALFGYDLGAASVDARTSTSSKNSIMLPTGREIPFEDATKTEHQKWVDLVPEPTHSLEKLQSRVRFNIGSAQWAAKFYEEKLDFKKSIDVSDDEIDITSPDHTSSLPTTAGKSYVPVRPKGIAPMAGDHLICDACSKQSTCKYYRSGSTCMIPETQPAQLAEMFQTRSPELLLDAMTVLLSGQAARFQRGMKEELDTDRVANKDVTALGRAVFDAAERLVKLVDPSRTKSATTVNVLTGGSTHVGVMSDSPSIVAAAMAELEAQGIPRDQITVEMVNEKIGKERVDAFDVQAIEAAVNDQ